MGKGARKEFCCDDAYNGMECTCQRDSWLIELQERAKYFSNCLNFGDIVLNKDHGSFGEIMSTSPEVVEIKWTEISGNTYEWAYYSSDNRQKDYINSLRLYYQSNECKFTYTFSRRDIVFHIPTRDFPNYLGIGEVINLSQNGKLLEIKWMETNNISKVEYGKTLLFFDKIGNLDNSTFDLTFREGYIIRDKRYGIIGAIRKVSNDRRTLTVFWDGADEECLLPISEHIIGNNFVVEGKGDVYTAKDYADAHDIYCETGYDPLTGRYDEDAYDYVPDYDPEDY
ncbi:hypothetical protein [Neobacillus sp. SAB-20_R2A]|uniref:hypothetical protein n=1 Tax=Neobacillus sp. SAB-20_R2A TaxID=3120519 RepID=UPI003C6E5809